MALARQHCLVPRSYGKAITPPDIKDRYHAQAKMVSLDATPYYHCVSRCVRRAFLCGDDSLSGKSYEHRRQWIQDRMKMLATVFAIDLCAYAVMSNHYHVVLHIDRQKAEGWDETDVIRRWQQVFVGHPAAQRYLAGESLLDLERKLVALWRSRLNDISWYMRCLNEAIAYQANEEEPMQRTLLGRPLQVPGPAR